MLPCQCDARVDRRPDVFNLQPSPTAFVVNQKLLWLCAPSPRFGDGIEVSPSASPISCNPEGRRPCKAGWQLTKQDSFSLLEASFPLNHVAFILSQARNKTRPQVLHALSTVCARLEHATCILMRILLGTALARWCHGGLTQGTQGKVHFFLKGSRWKQISREESSREICFENETFNCWSIFLVYLVCQVSSWGKRVALSHKVHKENPEFFKRGQMKT